jgi:outer membrane protein OmpA-like peptidoglycan-associated protein
MSQQRAQAVVDYLIKHAIDEGRMEAVGLGESQPKVVDAALAAQYPFLRVGARLDERYIKSLNSEEQQEICHQLNRRTEFQVLDDNYVLQP